MSNAGLKKENEKEILNSFDKKQIQNEKRKNKKSLEMYKLSKEKNNLNTQIEIDKIKNEGEKLDAINSVASKRIQNVKTETQISKLNRLIGFNKSINEHQEKEIKNTLKKGKRFKRCSMIASVISAITTCLGIKNSMSPEMWLIASGLIIIIAVMINMLINSTANLIKKFVNGKADIAMVIVKVSAIFGYTIYSVLTNFKFWNQYMDITSTFLFSIIYDALAIIMSVESDKYLNLAFNDKYKEEIENVVKNDDAESEDIEKKSKKKLSVAV